MHAGGIKVQLGLGAERKPPTWDQAMTSPCVSVIVPTRGRRDLLGNALASLVAQDLKEWECIVVIDGADDADAVIPHDDRIQIVRRGVAGGPAAARNTGLGVARGRFVAFLDDDDEYTSDRLSRAIREIGEAGLHLVGLGYLNERRGPATNPSDILARPAPLRAVGPSPQLGQCLIRRQVCPEFRPQLRTSEDVDWWLRVSRFVNINGSDEVGYLYRRHASPRPDLGDHTRLASRIELLELNKDALGRSRRLRAYHVNRVAAEALRMGENRVALTYSSRSVLSWPSKLAVKVAVKSILESSSRVVRDA